MSGHAHHRNYVKIWAILMGLLIVSIVGPMTGIRVVMLITAFGIALVKAYMVAKNFMHLDVEKPIVHWMMGIALIFMVLLFAGVAPDVMKGEGRGWKKDAGFHPVEAVGRAHGEAGSAAGHGGVGEGSHAAPDAASGAPGEAGSDATGAPGEAGSAPEGVVHDSTDSGH